MTTDQKISAVSDPQTQQALLALQAEMQATDDWANGVFQLLHQVLPHLLRGHPNVEKIQNSLQFSDARYEELLLHPERAEEGETAGQYEAGKMMHRQLAILGVWPGIESSEAVRQSLARLGWQRDE